MGSYHVWSTGDTWVFCRTAQVSQCGSLPEGVSDQRCTFLCRNSPADFTVGMWAVEKPLHLTFAQAYHTLHLAFVVFQVFQCLLHWLYKDGLNPLGITYELVITRYYAERLVQQSAAWASGLFWTKRIPYLVCGRSQRRTIIELSVAFVRPAVQSSIPKWQPEIVSLRATKVGGSCWRNNRMQGFDIVALTSFESQWFTICWITLVRHKYYIIYIIFILFLIPYYFITFFWGGGL